MSPANLGRKEGRLAAGRLWTAFLETADTDHLPLSKAAAHHAGADRAHDLSIDTPGATEAFISAFAQAMHDEFERKTKALIPRKLKPRIHHFCMLAHWLDIFSQGHPEADVPAHYGLGLHVPGRKLVLHPASVGAVAKRRGRTDAREEWKAYLDRPEPLPARIHWTKVHREAAAEQSFHSAYEFPESVGYGSPSYANLVGQWKRAWAAAYKAEIGVRIKAWAPPKIRKMYKHVCALALRLGLHVEKMVAIQSAAGEDS